MMAPLPLDDARGVAASIQYGGGSGYIISAIRAFNRRLPRRGYVARMYPVTLRGVRLVAEVEEPIPGSVVPLGEAAPDARLLSVYPDSRKIDLFDLLTGGDRDTLLSLLARKGEKA